MITYNSRNKTFNSKFKTYDNDQISTALIYEWVKTKQLTLKDFDAYINNILQKNVT